MMRDDRPPPTRVVVFKEPPPPPAVPQPRRDTRGIAGVVVAVAVIALVIRLLV